MTLTELLVLLENYNARNHTPFNSIQILDDGSGALMDRDNVEYVNFDTVEELVSLLRGEKTSHESMQ